MKNEIDKQLGKITKDLTKGLGDKDPTKALEGLLGGKDKDKEKKK